MTKTVPGSRRFRLRIMCGGRP